jgi:hypothetical protein
LNNRIRKTFRSRLAEKRASDCQKRKKLKLSNIKYVVWCVNTQRKTKKV